jgi:hypothetical protein
MPTLRRESQRFCMHTQANEMDPKSGVPQHDSRCSEWRVILRIDGRL